MEFSTVPFKTMPISRYIQTRTFTQQISSSDLHFLHGDRLLSSLHARMRNNCSNLKCELFVNHLSETNLCEYCNVPENAYHYFSHCTRFTNERLQKFHSTRNLHPLNCQLLLFGSEAWNAGQHIEIVEAVHTFIKRTKRFT